MKLRPRSPWSGFHDAGHTLPVALTWVSSGCTCVLSRSKSGGRTDGRKQPHDVEIV